MTAVLALAGAVVGSYLLRITFVTLIDVERLPAVIRAALAYVGPAVIAAIVVTSLAHGDGHGGLRLSMAQLCGLVTAAVAARLTGSLLWGLSAAMAVFILVGTLG